MTELRCKICGGKLQMDSNGESSKCESCGVEYSMETLRNMIQALQGVEFKVKVVADNDNLLLRAQKAAESYDTKTAIEYFDKVLDADVSNQQVRDVIADCFKKYIDTDVSVAPVVSVANMATDLLDYAKRYYPEDSQLRDTIAECLEKYIGIDDLKAKILLQFAMRYYPKDSQLRDTVTVYINERMDTDISGTAFLLGCATSYYPEESFQDSVLFFVGKYRSLHPDVVQGLLGSAIQYYPHNYRVWLNWFDYAYEEFINKEGVILQKINEDVCGIKKIIVSLNGAPDNRNFARIYNGQDFVTFKFLSGFVEAAVTVPFGEIIFEEWEGVHGKAREPVIYYEIANITAAMIKTSICNRASNAIQSLDKAIEFSDGSKKEKLKNLKNNLLDLSNADVEFLIRMCMDFKQEYCVWTKGDYNSLRDTRRIVDKYSVQSMRLLQEQRWESQGCCRFCGGKLSVFGKKCKSCNK